MLARGNRSSAAPIQGSNNGAAVVFLNRGKVTYHVTTGASQLTFVKAVCSHCSSRETFGGQPVSVRPPELPPPEFNQCSQTQLTENGNDYQGEFQRG